MISHKCASSREDGVEIVVEELSTHMIKLGIQVDIYNRSRQNVAGSKYYKNNNKLNEYKGCRILTIFTFEDKKLNAVTYLFLATVRVLFGHYDVIHFHEEDPCFMIWLPHFLEMRIVATIHSYEIIALSQRKAAKRLKKFSISCSRNKNFYSCFGFWT